jgi:hypothetical protein
MHIRYTGTCSSSGGDCISRITLTRSSAQKQKNNYKNFVTLVHLTNKTYKYKTPLYACSITTSQEKKNQNINLPGPRCSLLSSNV